MRFLSRSYTALFLLAVTFGLLALAGQIIVSAFQERRAETSASPPARERVFAVNVVPAVPADIAPELRVYGEIRSSRTLDLRTPIRGTVIALSPDFVDGGVVEQGEVLLQLDPTEAEAALQTAAADLRDANSEQRDAQKLLVLAVDDVRAAENQAKIQSQAFERQKDLLDRGVGSAAAVETAELAYASAEQTIIARRQALANAEARVDQAATLVERRTIAESEAQRRLDETEIKADFSGALSNVSVIEGGVVAANERVAQMIDTKTLEVAIRLSTSQHARLLDDQGQLRPAPVTVEIDVLGLRTSASGQLVREAPAVAEGQTGRIVYARLDTAPEFRPGDFVTVVIEEPILHDVIRLPATALNGQNEVLIVNAQERLEAAFVMLERRQGDDVLVRSADIVGQDIVAQRTPLLGAGIKVRAVRRDLQAKTERTEMLRLDPQRRARLIAFVESDNQMSTDLREQLLLGLRGEEVPREMVERIESRIEG